MKKLTITFSVLSLLAFAACNNETKTEETTAATDTTTAAAPAEQTPPPDSAAMAKAWEAYMTPGDMHKWLASTDGNWDAELTFWQGPDAPASPPSKASVVQKTIMGGRYQQSTYTGEMMGMPFEGHGTVGYDNAKKKFVSTWIDNMGTGVMYMEGPWDEATKSMTLTGKAVDASTGKEVDMREVLKVVDDKNQVMEMYCTQGGKEFKNMEIKLTKK